jgi:hypothetical protein
MAGLVQAIPDSEGTMPADGRCKAVPGSPPVVNAIA